jgi:predicted helicase
LKKHYNHARLATLGSHGGTEFYDYDKVNPDELELYFMSNNIAFDKYTSLNKTELDQLTEPVNDKDMENCRKDFIEQQKIATSQVTIRPNEQQRLVLNKINGFYAEHSKGKLIWACGLGKTLLSLLIVIKLGFRIVLIGVPSLYLQKQFKQAVLDLFKSKENILCIGSDSGMGVKSTTNVDIIKRFYLKPCSSIKFIISTYNSCHLLATSEFRFDFKIADEAHHIASTSNTTYNKFHEITTSKALFMTATEKTSECGCSGVMSDYNTFGGLIDEKTVCWSIENNKITDYNIIVVRNNEQELARIVEQAQLQITNTSLFVSSFMSLKAMNDYDGLTHVLLYTNSTENANLVQKYIKTLLIHFTFDNLDPSSFYIKALHSKMKANIKINDEVNYFTNSLYGIISCVHIFGEGFDLPKLNGVVFAEPMDSEIRIVQSALRPNRLDVNNPEKQAYIIIPYIDELRSKTTSFDKCRSIIAKLRHVDQNIEQKIKVVSVRETRASDDEPSQRRSNQYHLYVNKDELLKFKLKLKQSKALHPDFTEEQTEYELSKQANKMLNIRSKEHYNCYEIRTKLDEDYVENAEAYFKAKGVWTNWYDFLGYDTSVFIQTKKEWLSFCKARHISTVSQYKELCLTHPQLPMDPGEFYIDFSNIYAELNVRQTRR